MEFFKYCLPRTVTGQAALLTVLYCLLVIIALYAPIDPHAPMVLAFGSRTEARQLMTAFVQLMFWPIVVLLVVSGGRESIERLLAKRRGS